MDLATTIQKSNSSISSSASTSSRKSLQEDNLENNLYSPQKVLEIIQSIIDTHKKEIENYQLFTQKEIREQKAKINELANNIKEANENNEENKNELKGLKIDFIAVMGVFVSIFTFISIEIQILKYVCDFFRIVGFSLIIFGSLAGFMILLYSIFGQRKNQLKLWLLCFIPFFIGILIGSVPFFKKVNNSCIISSENFSKFERRLEKLETPVKIEQENIKETLTTP